MPGSSPGIRGDGFPTSPFAQVSPPEPAHSTRTNSSATGQTLIYCRDVSQESLPKKKKRKANTKKLNLYTSGEWISIPPLLFILRGLPLANLQPVGVSFATKPSESLLRCLGRSSSDLNPPPFTRDKKSISATGPEALQPPAEQEQLHGHA